MNSVLVWAVLTLAVDPLPDGSLVFLENCNSFVEFSTGGELGHVALALADGEMAWIYEATPAKVRRVSYNDYLAELAHVNERRQADNRVRVWGLHPKEPWSEQELTVTRDYLSEQLGRRYSVKNYLIGQPGDGVHCAELAAMALTRSGRCRFEECHKLHPTALYAATLPLYQSKLEIEIPALAVQETWCARAQRRWSGWFNWCGWSCSEALSFCW